MSPLPWSVAMVGSLPCTSCLVLSVRTSDAPPPLDTRLFILLCHHVETPVAQCSQNSAALSQHFSFSPSHWNGEIETGYPAEDWRCVEIRKNKNRSRWISGQPKFHLLIMHSLNGQWVHALTSLFLSPYHAKTTLNLLKYIQWAVSSVLGQKRSRLSIMSMGVRA